MILIRLLKYIFWTFPGELINHGNNLIYLWIKNRRKRYAIKEANRLCKLNRGRKYYVLKSITDPDKYMIKHRKQLMAMQKAGVLKPGLDWRDYTEEAVYITKNNGGK